MDETSGWLWAIIGVFGIGGLAVCLAYGTAFWQRRRKSPAERDVQAAAVRENYRRGG
jgi:hypothetical protein